MTRYTDCCGWPIGDGLGHFYDCAFAKKRYQALERVAEAARDCAVGSWAPAARLREALRNLDGAPVSDDTDRDLVLRMEPRTRETMRMIRPLRWSKEAPTVAGWYWWRHEVRRAAYPLRVVCLVDGGAIDDEGEWMRFDPTDEWAGPIEKPSDA